jgi:hypothetical protein
MIAVSQNISAHGILLLTESPIAERSRLQLAILVGPPGSSKATLLLANGKVVRAEPRSASGFEVAVCCTRPFRMTSGGTSGIDQPRRGNSF